MRWKYKCSNPFTSNVDNVPTNLQFELIELQEDSFLKDKYNETGPLGLYSILASTERFPLLLTSAKKIASLFGSTYLCERTFSTMKLAKSKSRSRLTDEHLKSILRVSVSNFEPQFENIMKGKQLHVSHSSS